MQFCNDDVELDMLLNKGKDYGGSVAICPNEMIKVEFKSFSNNVHNYIYFLLKV